MKVLLLVYILQYQYSAAKLSLLTQKTEEKCSGNMILAPPGSPANFVTTLKKIETEKINLLKANDRFSFMFDNCGGIGFSLRNIPGFDREPGEVVAEWSGEVDLGKDNQLYVFFEEIASVNGKLMIHVVVQGSTGIDLESLYVFKAAVDDRNIVAFDMTNFDKLLDQRTERGASNQDATRSQADEDLEKEDFITDALAKSESIIEYPDRTEPKSIREMKDSSSTLDVKESFKILDALPLTFVFDKQQFKHDTFCHLYQAMILTKIQSFRLTVLPSRTEREYHSILFTPSKLI